MTIDHPTSAQLPSMQSLWHEAFGDEDGFLDAFLQTAYAPDHARVIAEGDEVLSALYWMDVSLDGAPLAYVYAVATRASRRGEGLAGRLLEDTHALLSARGYAGAILVPSEPSLFDFYARFGYTPCAPMQSVFCEAAGEPLTLHRVSGEEYARLRDACLPQGGVRPGEAMLRLLAATALLYAGENLLVAVSRSGEQIVADELFGDVALAPRVLSALGAKAGRFRIAGGARDLAMARPLTDAPLPPICHFSLAFD